jgi:nucleoid-associated protein YgaU
MPNDAKLGLVVGVALVIAVALVFFRKDGGSRLAVMDAPAPTAATVPEVPPATVPRDPAAGLPVNQVSRQRIVAREHVIQPGDTLFSIARQHYGNADRFDEIYRANREALQSPDNLPAGLTLKIP